MDQAVSARALELGASGRSENILREHGRVVLGISIDSQTTPSGSR